MFYSPPEVNYSSVLGVWVMVDKYKKTELILENVFAR